MLCDGGQDNSARPTFGIWCSETRCAPVAEYHFYAHSYTALFPLHYPIPCRNAPPTLCAREDDIQMKIRFLEFPRALEMATLHTQTLPAPVATLLPPFLFYARPELVHASQSAMRAHRAPLPHSKLPRNPNHLFSLPEITVPVPQTQRHVKVT